MIICSPLLIDEGWSMIDIIASNSGVKTKSGQPEVLHWRWLDTQCAWRMCMKNTAERRWSRRQNDCAALRLGQRSEVRDTCLDGHWTVFKRVSLFRVGSRRLELRNSIWRFCAEPKAFLIAATDGWPLLPAVAHRRIDNLSLRMVAMRLSLESDLSRWKEALNLSKAWESNVSADEFKPNRFIDNFLVHSLEHNMSSWKSFPSCVSADNS